MTLGGFVKFSTVFEAPLSDTTAPVWPILVLLGLALALCMLVYHLRKPRFAGPITSRVRFLLSGIAAGALLIAFILSNIRTSHNDLYEAVREGRIKVVEGVVENFHPMPREGHDQEHFSVGGIPFAYSDYIITGGFNNTSSHGGPIATGRYVRLAYVARSNGNTIVKLEVGAVQPSVPPDDPASTPAALRQSRG